MRSTEAWWRPVQDGGRLSGKVEWDAFASGRTELGLYVRGLEVPDDTTVEVWRGDELLVSSPVRRGKARHRLDSADGVHVPELRVGDAVVLRAGGQELATATAGQD